MKERAQQVLTRFFKVNTFMTFEDLSKEFATSERTMRNELTLINEFLADNNYPTVTTVRGHGLKLELSDKDREALLSKINLERETDYYRPDERFLALLLDIMDMTKTTILYEMEETLQVSKSTLDDDMRKLRSFLKEYGISISSLPKQGVVLRGNERSIRSMLYKVITSMIDLDSLLFSKRDSSMMTFSEQLVIRYLNKSVLEQTGNHYDRILKNEGVAVTTVYRNHIILFLGIWIRRLQEEKTLNELAEVRSNLEEKAAHKFVDVLCLDFNLSPSVHEIKYITFTIESFNSKDMNNSFDWGTAQLLAIQLIEHVENVTGIPFSQKEDDLYEGLYRHITGLLSRIQNDLQVSNPLKDTIKESYGEIYQAVSDFKRQIEYYTKKLLTDDETGFLTIYFSTSASRMKQDAQFVYQAVVLCHHGISTGKLLAANLKEQFNVEIVAVLSSHEIGFIDKLDVDLVFTTIAIDYLKKPVLLLNPILRESDKKQINAFLIENQDRKRTISKKLDATGLMQDILALITESGGSITKDIYQSVEAVFKERHLKINTKEIQPMLKDILKDSHILLNQECNNWKEAIAKSADALLASQVIEERYIDAMIKSVEEYGPYIVVGKHLALAHARPEDGVNELGISVMTLKEPVVFGNSDNDPVKIIFCLAAVDSYSHLNLMKNLIELINDPEKLDKLTASQDKDSFNNILYGTAATK